jgi:hypothetical protein
MPEAVVARLDRVLPASPRPHRTRRARPTAPRSSTSWPVGRRTVGQLLVAAAAVVAVGFGITRSFPDLGGELRRRRQAANGRRARPPQTAGAATATASPEPEACAGGPLRRPRGGAAKSTFRIRSDELRARRAPRPQPAGARERRLLEYPAEGCLAVSVEPGSEVVATTYDAAPAALVLRPPSGDVQVVDLYLCGDLEPRVRSR